MRIKRNIKAIHLLLLCAVLCTLAFVGADKDFNTMAKKMGAGKAPFLSVKELNQWQTQEKDMLVLDTREQKEFDISHIKNAVFVGYDDFKIAAVSKKYAKNTLVVCYCSVGYRSQKIAEKLLKYGYTKVYNLYGGLFNWVNSGYKVYDTKGNTTTKVHAYNSSWSKWLTKGEKVLD